MNNHNIGIKASSIQTKQGNISYITTSAKICTNQFFDIRKHFQLKRKLINVRSTGNCFY